MAIYNDPATGAIVEAKNRAEAMEKFDELYANDLDLGPKPEPEMPGPEPEKKETVQDYMKKYNLKSKEK